MGWCLHPIWGGGGGAEKKIFRYANLSALPLSYTPHFPNPRNIPGYYGTLIGNPTPGIQWYNFRPPGVTLTGEWAPREALFVKLL